MKTLLTILITAFVTLLLMIFYFINYSPYNKIKENKITEDSYDYKELVKKEAYYLQNKLNYQINSIDSVLYKQKYLCVYTDAMNLAFYLAGDGYTEVNFCKNCEFNWDGDNIKGCDKCNHSILAMSPLGTIKKFEGLKKNN